MAIYKIEHESNKKETQHLLFAEKQGASTNSEWVRISIEKHDSEYIEVWTELKNEGAHPIMNPQLLPKVMIEVEQDRLQAAIALIILYAERVLRKKLDTRLLSLYREEIAKEVAFYLKN